MAFVPHTKVEKIELYDDGRFSIVVRTLDVDDTTGQPRPNGPNDLQRATGYGPREATDDQPARPAQPAAEVIKSLNDGLIAAGFPEVMETEVAKLNAMQVAAAMPSASMADLMDATAQQIITESVALAAAKLAAETLAADAVIERDEAIAAASEAQEALTVAQEQAAGMPALPVIDGVPQVISKMQAKLALLGAGRLDAVETHMAKTDPAAQIYWTDASHIHRDHPLVVGIGAALDMSAEEIDALFVAAKAIA